MGAIKSLKHNGSNEVIEKKKTEKKKNINDKAC